jgi:hypothetical protein
LPGLLHSKNLSLKNRKRIPLKLCGVVIFPFVSFSGFFKKKKKKKPPTKTKEQTSKSNLYHNQAFGGNF